MFFARILVFNKIIRSLTILIFLLNLVCASDIAISDSLKHFKYPRFSQSGYIEWVLEGKTGSYIDSKIKVEDLSLRVFSGDANLEKMLKLEGGMSILEPNLGITYSDGNIKISGKGFEINGNNWSWNSKNQLIKIKNNVSVRFTQNIDSVFTGNKDNTGTLIKSDYLSLIINSDGYSFKFKDSVELNSDEIFLKCESLGMALLSSTNQKKNFLEIGELSKIDSITGKGQVNLVFLDKRINSDKFNIFPKNESAEFEGNPILEFNNIKLEGEKLSILKEVIFIESFKDSNASLVLKDVSKEGNISNDIFINSSYIEFRSDNAGYKFLFDKNVMYNDSNYNIMSDYISILTKKLNDIKNIDVVQDIKSVEAKGFVELTHPNYQCSCADLLYDKSKGVFVLKDNVNYKSNFIKLASDYLMLEEDSLLAESYSKKVLIDIAHGVEFGLFVNDNFEKNLDQIGTAIESKVFNLKKINNKYNCIFDNEVKLERGALKLFSGALEMDWTNNQRSSTRFKLDKVFAYEGVKIQEGDYLGEADKVDLDPKKEIIFFQGNAFLNDSNGSLSGDIIRFNRKTKRTKIMSSKENNKRARFKFDLNKELLE